MTETQGSEPIPEWVRPWSIEGVTEALRARMTVRDDAVLGRRIRFTLLDAGGPILPRLDLYPELLVVRYRDRDDLVRFHFRSVDSIVVEGDHVVLASGDPEAAMHCQIYPHGELRLALVTSASITHDRTRRRR